MERLDTLNQKPIGRDVARSFHSELKMHVKLEKEKIEKIFSEAKRPEDYLIGVYSLVFPEWGRIKHINAWPTVNEKTGAEFFRLAIEADARIARVNGVSGVMFGGAWMSNGFSFSPDRSLPDWTADLSTCSIEYQEANV
jgi:hypothetical protein